MKVSGKPDALTI